MPRTKPATRKPPSKPTPTGLTINLPGGGRATFRAEHELTPRHTRPIESLSLAMSSVIKRISDAQELTGAVETSDDVLPGEAFDVTEEQADNMGRLNDLAILAYLKSWTLDLPLPGDVDALMDIPNPVYAALRTKAAELYHAGQLADRFTVDSLPDDLDDADEDLPTSA